MTFKICGGELVPLVALELVRGTKQHAKTLTKANQQQLKGKSRGFFPSETLLYFLKFYRPAHLRALIPGHRGLQQG